ncbi:MAG: hypothetical protein WC603_00560 [Candidatus Paceibacterota bacterium]|jgi:hypothetical protein
MEKKVDSTLVQEFKGRQTSEVELVNDFLTVSLATNMDVGKILADYFKKRDCPRIRGLKTFNLERWSGSESNPTIELVKVGKTFFFGMTHYGMLGPLKNSALKNEAVKDVIISFILNPLKFAQK